MIFNTCNTLKATQIRQEIIRNPRKLNQFIIRSVHFDICDEFRHFIQNKPVTEFKEFERRFKFKPRFKYGWFH